MLNTHPDDNLTRRQLLIWVEQQLDPESPANDAVALFRLQGELDPQRFEQAFRSVVARSDAMRTVFEERRPMQRVRREIPFGLEVEDWSAAEDPERRLSEWLENRRARRLRLTDRAFDCALLHTGASEWAWYLRVHNLIGDASSLSIVYRATERAYAGDYEEALPPFAAYFDHERAYRRSPRARAAETFWKQRLAERLERLDFYGRPAARSARLARTTLRLSSAHADALRARAQEGAHAAFTPKVAVFSAMMAVCFGYLHRATGQRRIGIGAPAANRTSKAFRDTIGRFAEISPFRCTIDARDTFAILHEKTTQEVYEVLRHAQHCVANPLHRRAFEVLLNFHNVTFPAFHECACHAELFTGAMSPLAESSDDEPRSGSSQAPGESLIWNVHDFSDTGIPSISFDFDSGVFDAIAREKAVRDFMQTLEDFLEHPARAVGGPAHAQMPSRPAASLVEPLLPIASGHDVPNTDAEVKIAVLWGELLGIDRITRRQNFFEIGGSSLLAVRLLRAVEDAFGVAVPFARFFESPTVEALAATVSAGSATAGPALIPLQSRGLGQPFFLVCGIQLYHELAEEIGPIRPCFGMFLPVEQQMLADPGVQGEEHPIITVEAMAREYVALIQAQQPTGPYSLAGLSFGGVLAFEVAQQLRRAGERVALLALFDPILPRAHRRVLGSFIWSHAKALARLDLSHARARFAARAARVHSVEADPLARLRERIYTRAVLAYDGHLRPFTGPVVLYRAMDRTASPGWCVERSNGWADVISEGLEIVDVPGDHTGILRRPSVRVIADDLRPRLLAGRYLERARTA